uniref:Olfactory receptor family 2 subfamily AG member 12 n=1 Tax=Nannospalax galili TaxID=1026970 RepID=A0A8C6REQ2_NANGA
MDHLLTSVITPKAVMDFLLRYNTISFGGCALQMFLEVILVGQCRGPPLTFVAYDSFIIYMIFMRPRICWLRVPVSWIPASLSALEYIIYTMQYPFCKSQQIRHLLCKSPSVPKLACADMSRYQLMVYLMGMTLLITRLAAILGRKKALDTCSLHLTVVRMFYGALTVMYILPSSYHSPKQENILSVFYTIVTPALNPLIYSFQNKEDPGALRRVLGKRLLTTHSNF